MAENVKSLFIPNLDTAKSNFATFSRTDLQPNSPFASLSTQVMTLRPWRFFVGDTGLKQVSHWPLGVNLASIML